MALEAPSVSMDLLVPSIAAVEDFFAVGGEADPRLGLFGAGAFVRLPVAALARNEYCPARLRRAREADEQEALTLLDQIRKLEDRLEEAESALKEAKASLEPRRRELLEGQEQAQAEFSSLEEGREAYSSQVKTDDLRVYEAIKAGGRSIAVSNLTSDGACGHCFNMVPLQTRTEIRNGTEMIRCEACGVILTPPGPELPEVPAAQQGAPDAEVDDSEVSPDAAADADLEEGDG